MRPDGARDHGRSPGRRRRRAAAILALGLVPMAGTAAYVANAAVPAFPDNIVIFPDRDFVTVEGFQDHVGETATLEIRRNGTVIGAAKAEVAAGDVAFEVNHPGGVCWGAGTGVNVTPDIQPGDTATISFEGFAAGDTVVQDAHVSHLDYTPGASTFKVIGHVGSAITRTQMEQRIVNPDLTDTAVGRRDIRAVPGGLVRAARGGYSSNLEFAGETFTATYVFDDPEVARIAATGGGERIMAWQVEDADANRQGLTISEAGESGGPGMGGCPAGPADVGAPAPGTASVVRSSDKTKLQVRWTAATAAPGTTPVSGYEVAAVSETSDAGQRSLLGKRTDAGIDAATITVDPSQAYTVEVRSIAGARMSEPFTVKVPSGAPAGPSGDLLAPKITADPPATPGVAVEARAVTLKADEAADIYYTVDGSPALANGDLPSQSAKLYTNDPIVISEPTQLRWAAFDRAGNFVVGSGLYTPPTAAIPVPDAPTLATSTAGQATLTARWSTTDTTVKEFGVQLFSSDGGKVGGLRTTTERSLTINDLAPDTYTFTVQARNSPDWGAASVQSGPLKVTPVTDRITIGTARWKTGDFRVTGTGSAATATLTIRENSETGTVLGTGRMTAATAPATGGVYDLRFRDTAAPRNRPATIYVVSSLGGIAGPFTVSAG